MPTSPKTILVTGGAGYIGSHMVLLLRQAGYVPIVLDNLSTGHRDAIPDGVKFIEADLTHADEVQAAFAAHRIDAVMHFAGLIEVAESVQQPLRYYQHNVMGSMHLLSAMIANDVHHLVFSSSAAVYGDSQAKLITETHPLHPLNPYGHSKWMVEEMIRDVAASHGMQYAILRYFNAAGADPDGRAHEQHQPESHLIPILLEAAAGKRKQVTVYGHRHPTPDGSCVRDYVHVLDICQAHLLTLQAMFKGQSKMLYNIGIGRGYSVLQVAKAVERVTGRPVPLVMGPIRPGDPATLVADPEKIKGELRWQPRYTDLDTLIQHAWRGVTLPK